MTEPRIGDVSWRRVFVLWGPLRTAEGRIAWLRHVWERREFKNCHYAPAWENARYRDMWTKATYHLKRDTDD